jgi:putative ABC transport system permease protein
VNQRAVILACGRDRDRVYRTGINIGTFFLAGIVAWLIALLTVSYQAVKASMADPVKSLKYE